MRDPDSAVEVVTRAIRAARPSHARDCGFAARDVLAALTAIGWGPRASDVADDLAGIALRRKACTDRLNVTPEPNALPSSP